jgi:hypothetical protein
MDNLTPTLELNEIQLPFSCYFSSLLTQMHNPNF